MKTSNKILVGLFISVLLLIAGIHVALTQRYKNGQFTISHLNENKDSITIKPVKYLSLKGLENVVLIPSGDYHLEFEKGMPSNFRYYVSGDTLVVTGQHAVSTSGPTKGRRIYQEVSVHTPALSKIVAENSSLGIEGLSDTASIAATHIDLLDSRLSFENRLNQGAAPVYFGDVFITARQGSEVGLSPNKIHFNTLSFELEKSIFRDNESGEIKNLFIKADDSSLVQVSGRNLQKLR